MEEDSDAKTALQGQRGQRFAAAEEEEAPAVIQWNFFHGCRSLFTERDENYMTLYHCLIRQCIDVFSSSQEDIKRLPAVSGKFSHPLAVGQVGIRCKFCEGGKKNDASTEMKDYSPSLSVYYPFKMKDIYALALKIATEHVTCCPAAPDKVKMKINSFQNIPRSRSGRKEYWVKVSQTSTHFWHKN